MKPSILPTAIAVAALAFAAAAVVPAHAQMKEQTVTVGGAPMYPSKNIIQNAMNSKDHTTLVAAVKAAGLVETLQGSGPFTVFAPTNAAFQKLPAGTVDSLLKPQMKEKLVAVLTYHVLPGRLGQCVARDHPERVPVERRHPRHRQRADAELTSLALGQPARSSAHPPRRWLGPAASLRGGLLVPWDRWRARSS